MTVGPLQVGVAELRRRLGTRRPIERTAGLEGLAVSASEVPTGAEVEVRVVLESISNGVVAEGAVEAPWRAACRRCLRPVEGTLRAEVREIFDVAPVDGETYPLAGDTIDLEPLVRDAVLLALPLAPLCGTGCAGPAPETFPTGPPDSSTAGRTPGNGFPDREPARDPRWAALDDLRFEDPGGSEGTG